MSDEDKPPRQREPFLSLVDKAATAQNRTLKEQLDRLHFNSELILKRMQQTAMMVDGFGNTINRRFDVLHEEAAMLRASVQRADSSETPQAEPFPLRPRPAQSVRRAAMLTGKGAIYATFAAVVLRFVGKLVPQYGDAIDSVLGVFGL